MRTLILAAAVAFALPAAAQTPPEPTPATRDGKISTGISRTSASISG